jgi:hypothetical protein
MSTMSELEKIRTSIRRELGRQFSLTLLQAHIAYLRNKPLRVEEAAMRIGVTGACFALDDCDLALVRRGLTGRRQVMTHLHEYGHILLGHAPQLSITYAQFKELPSGDQMLCRSIYDTPNEQAAETLASLLFPHVVVDDDLPDLARALYGAT